MEYWIDFGKDKTEGYVGVKMPKKYVVEMFIDRVSASKVYNFGNYNDGKSWEYYSRGKDWYVIHPDTKKLLEHLIIKLRDEGEKATFSYIKHVVLKRKFPY
jgi:hypothetical protein